MKTVTAFALCLALLLAGCAQAPVEPTSPPPVPTQQVPEDTAPSTQATQQATQPQPERKLPMAAISMPTVTETLHSDNGTLLFSYSFPSVSFIHPDTEIARTVMLELRNRIDASRGKAEQLKTQAASGYTGGDYWDTYLLEIDYTPTRLDQSILSLYGHETTYGGGTRPNIVPTAVTYDLVSGNVLGIRDILSEDYTVDQLCRLIVDALDALSRDGLLFPDYAQTVTDMFTANTLPESWYFSETGLVFYFAPYEIGPYSSGDITAEIPYEQLNGILRDGYYPAEVLASGGELMAELFADADLSQFSRFAEAVLDEDGTQVLLYPSGTISHVRIERGLWNYDSFTVFSTVFACDTLSTGDAIMLQHLSPGDMPELRISFTAGSKNVSLYIGYSGLDGSVILTP